MSSPGNDLDAAKTISDLLKDMEKERQQRVLRWVAESLDIALHVRTGAQHDTSTGTAAEHQGEAEAQETPEEEDGGKASRTEIVGPLWTTCSTLSN